MNFKNIDNIFIIIILLIVISCSKQDLINKENSNINIVETNTIETLDYIDETSYNNTSEFLDYYNRNNNFNWKESIKLKKIYNIIFGKKSKIVSKSPSNIIISDNYVFYVDNESNFFKIDLNENNIVFEIQLEENLNSNLTLPTSLIKNKDVFYVGFGNGTVIKLNNNGKKLWKKDFNELIRTPLRIVNDNIILIFNSNKIISLNLDNGDKIWEYVYDLNKPSLSSGGQILVKHNIIYFVMPNGRIGAIDNIVGEPVDYSFLNNFLQKNILHYNYDTKLHIHDNFLSLFEDNNILYTYDLDNEKFLLFDKKIYFVKSFYFLNNSLVVLENNNFLTSYNLINNKIFWKVDLSKILSKKENIIESFVINNTVLIFFSSGKIVQLNKSNGELLFTQDLNLNDIDLVTASSSYFIFNHINGKAFFYSQ